MPAHVTMALGGNGLFQPSRSQVPVWEVENNNGESDFGVQGQAIRRPSLGFHHTRYPYRRFDDNKELDTRGEEFNNSKAQLSNTNKEKQLIDNKIVEDQLDKEKHGSKLPSSSFTAHFYNEGVSDVEFKINPDSALRPLQGTIYTKAVLDNEDDADRNFRGNRSLNNDALNFLGAGDRERFSQLTNERRTFSTPHLQPVPLRNRVMTPPTMSRFPDTINRDSRFRLPLPLGMSPSSVPQNFSHMPNRHTSLHTLPRHVPLLSTITPRLDFPNNCLWPLANYNNHSPVKIYNNNNSFGAHKRQSVFTPPNLMYNNRSRADHNIAHTVSTNWPSNQTPTSGSKILSSLVAPELQTRHRLSMAKLESSLPKTSEEALNQTSNSNCRNDYNEHEERLIEGYTSREISKTREYHKQSERENGMGALESTRDNVVQDILENKISDLPKTEAEINEDRPRHGSTVFRKSKSIEKLPSESSRALSTSSEHKGTSETTYTQHTKTTSNCDVTTVNVKPVMSSWTSGQSSGQDYPNIRHSSALCKDKYEDLSQSLDTYRSNSRGEWIVCRDYRSTRHSEYGGKNNVWDVRHQTSRGIQFKHTHVPSGNVRDNANVTKSYDKTAANNNLRRIADEDSRAASRTDHTKAEQDTDESLAARISSKLRDLAKARNREYLNRPISRELLLRSRPISRSSGKRPGSRDNARDRFLHHSNGSGFNRPVSVGQIDYGILGLYGTQTFKTSKNAQSSDVNSGTGKSKVSFDPQRFHCDLTHETEGVVFKARSSSHDERGKNIPDGVKMNPLSDNSSSEKVSEDLIDYFWSYQGMGRQILREQSGEFAPTFQGTQQENVGPTLDKFQRLPPIDASIDATHECARELENGGYYYAEDGERRGKQVEVRRVHLVVKIPDAGELEE